MKSPFHAIATPVRLLTLLCLPAASVQASFLDEYMIDEQDGMFDVSRYLSTMPAGFLLVPSIITEPAVGYGAAAMGIFFHETEAQKKTRMTQGAMLPENISILAGGGTDNGTWGLGAGHLGFWRQDSIRYRGFAGYASPNLDFYSLADIDLSKPIRLNITGPVVLQEIKFKLADSHWFAGVKQLYRHTEMELAKKFSTDDLTENQAAIADYLNEHLQRSTTTSGAGLVFEYDSRNNPLNPEKGYNYRAEYLWFSDAIGSDLDYESYRLTALNYWPLSEKLDFGLRVQYDALGGDTSNLPAYIPPSINLRGISKNRYQGDSVGVIETELSYKHTMRWKYLAFVGTGRTGDSLSDLGDGESLNNYGVGFRYLIARRYGFTMGADIAKGPEDTAFYIQAGSTW